MRDYPNGTSEADAVAACADLPIGGGSGVLSACACDARGVVRYCSAATGTRDVT